MLKNCILIYVHSPKKLSFECHLKYCVNFYVQSRDLRFPQFHTTFYQFDEVFLLSMSFYPNLPLPIQTVRASGRQTSGGHVLQPRHHLRGVRARRRGDQGQAALPLQAHDGGHPGQDQVRRQVHHQQVPAAQLPQVGLRVQCITDIVCY